MTLWRDRHFVFVGVGSGSPESRRVFKASMACFTALKSTGESVNTASLKDVNGFEGVDGRLCDGDDMTEDFCWQKWMNTGTVKATEYIFSTESFLMSCNKMSLIIQSSESLPHRFT